MRQPKPFFRKSGTYEKVRRHLSQYTKFIGKQTKIASVSGTDLAEWVEDETTWNSTTRNDGITSVVRCFNWAVGKNFLKSNNVANVPDKPVRKRREVVFSEDEWRELRSYVKDQAFGDLLDFTWETGCRPLEARTMEGKHVDLKAGLVIFPASEAKGERHERVSYLTERSIEICRARTERFSDGPIMRNTKGRPWTQAKRLRQQENPS